MKGSSYSKTLFPAMHIYPILSQLQLILSACLSKKYNQELSKIMLSIIACVTHLFSSSCKITELPISVEFQHQISP
jgi:hypothetical protein